MARLEFAAKAHSVELDLADGQALSFPKRALMLHDETGQKWPRRSVLIIDGDYELTPDRVEIGGTAKGWLGKGYEARRGECVMPPVDLEAWDLVGEAREIRYVRRGTFAPGAYFHEFKRERFLFPKHGPTLVHRHGNRYRIDLPPTGVINWRGFVKP